MLANAKPQLNETPTDRNVREVIAICAKDGVPYGELNSLVGFMRALNDNKQFAMHFWSLVARLSQQPHDAANPEWLLATIVEGATAKPLAEVREAGPAHRVLVTRLAKMIAGEDVQEPLEATPETATPKIIARRRNVSEAIAADAALSAPEADEGSIRERYAAKRAAPSEQITNPAWSNDESLRLVLRHDPVITEVPETRSNRIRLDRGPDIAIPLSNYSEESHTSRNAVIGIVALLLLGACSFAVYREGGTGALGRLGSSIHAGYDSAVSTWKGEPATQSQPPAPAPVATTPAAAQPSAQAVAQGPVSSAPAHSAETAQMPRQPSAAVQQPSAAVEQSGTATQQPGATAQQRTPTHRYYYRRPLDSESMAETAAAQQREPEPPAKVIPIPDVTTATPAPHATGTSHPEEAPSAAAPSTPSGGATGVSTPPSMEQQ